MIQFALAQGADRGAGLFGFDTHLPGWAAIPIFLLIWGLMTYGFLVASKRLISGIVFRPGRRAVELLLKTLHLPLVILFALMGAKFALDSDAFNPSVRMYGATVLVTLLAATLVFAAIRLTSAYIDEIATRYPGFTSMYTPVHYAARVLLVLLGALIWMQALGIPVTPLLVAAGIAGITLGLALQDTLRNFAAGVHLVLDRAVHIGDAITLEDGTSAVVLSIGWRSTRLRSADHSVIILPNRVLAEQKIVNHSLPQKWIIVTASIRLPKEVDLGQAEALLKDELGQAAEDIAAVRKEPPPVVSPVPGYAHTHLELTVSFAVSEFKDQVPARDELLRRLNDRLRTEGVGFASPKSQVSSQIPPDPRPD